MAHPPLSPGTVAEIACRYRRGESTPRIARALHLANSTVVGALDKAGVPRRSRSEAARMWWGKPAEPVCRCCGILLEKAGCGAYEGVCAACWLEALLLARRWGCGGREALERWIKEGRKIESGEAELGEWCGNIKRRARAT